MTSIDDYYALSPARFGPIVALDFVQRDDPGESHPVARLTLTMTERPMLSGRRLTLVFEDVRNVEFKQSSLSIAILGLIEISEAQGRHLVTEEEGRLRLDCATFRAALDPPEL